MGGCVDFEEQTASYRYDRATDELRVFQDYRGIFGSGTGGEAGASLSDKELVELKSVLDGQRTFFFNNWIFEYNREQLVEYRSRLDDLDQSGIAAEDRPQIEKLIDLALSNVRIANGPFYMAADGKLCGVQSVTIGKCSEIVASLNECMPAFLKSYGKDSGTTQDDRKAVAEFQAGADASLIRQDGNALKLRWPMSRATFDKTFGPTSDNPARAKEIHDSGIGIAWNKSVATFTVGKSDDKITEVNLKVSKYEYNPNAIGSARAKHRIQEPFDAGASAKAFLLGKAGGADTE
jgi:hypothetical protein